MFVLRSPREQKRFEADIKSIFEGRDADFRFWLTNAKRRAVRSYSSPFFNGPSDDERRACRLSTKLGFACGVVDVLDGAVPTRSDDDSDSWLDEALSLKFSGALLALEDYSTEGVLRESAVPASSPEDVWLPQFREGYVSGVLCVNSALVMSESPSAG